MAITPKPIQQPIPFYVACFSKTSMEMAARKGLNIIFAPFAAAMMFGGIENAVKEYREMCAKYDNEPGRAMCSYFIHIAETPEEDAYGRQAQMDYFHHCVIRALPTDPAKMPPTMRYFIDMVEALKNMKGEDLTDKSILVGPPGKIIESLERVEAAGIAEVILYFNVGKKPHGMVEEQMHRFMQDVAPAFEGKHRAAAE